MSKLSDLLCYPFCILIGVYIRVFGKINFVIIQLGELTMAVDKVHKPPKKFVGHLEQNSGLAVHFHFIKEIRKIYKGKYACGAYWLSFLT